MLFNSYIFIFLFLPITLAGYFLINRVGRHTLAQAFLLVASLVFYAYFNISYLWIIVISILFNYTASRLMHKPYKNPVRKLILIIALLCNVGLFVYFKYSNFFIDNINAVFKTSFFLENILLPLGISFFSFQQVSYVIDTYKREVPEYSFINYATFVAFFPQLIAGPIVLHNEIIPQFEDKNKKKIDFENFSKGIYAFAFGLAKKVLIADFFGVMVTRGYANLTGLNSWSALVVILAYTMQIYFDFSGYCDMATGLGLMFNIDIPMNFNSPYRAETINDFWKRWHMTLTRFFKRYLYFPLGGNRKGTLRTYLNMFIVFLVSGIWHGANWTFILWGILHGGAAVINRACEKVVSKIPKAINWLITFIFVNIAWVYFRAPSISSANLLIKKLFSFDFSAPLAVLAKASRPKFLLSLIDFIGQGAINTSVIPNAIYLPIVLTLAVFASVKMKNTNERINAFKPSALNVLVTVFLLTLSIISLAGVSEFLYFNF